MSDRTITIQSSDGLLTLPAIVEMADSYKMPVAAFVFTFRAMAMPQPHTEAEFVSCCLVAREHGLNPLTKEIYFMKTKGGGIQAIVSVDGWAKKCNGHPKFDGLEFEDSHDANGNLVSTTCVIYRSDRKHPIRVTEYLDECLQVGGPVWKTSPRRMLRHRSLTQCARYAFGFAGFMDMDEFQQWQGMRDITPTPRPATASLDDIPEIPDSSPSPANAEAPPVSDLPAHDGAFAERVLTDLAARLAKARSGAARLEVWEGMSDLVGSLPDEDQRRAEAVFEGRA